MERPRPQSRGEVLRRRGSALLTLSSVALAVAGMMEPTTVGFDRDVLIGGALAIGAMELKPNADKADRWISGGALFTAATCMAWALLGQQASDPASSEALMGLAGAVLYTGPALSAARHGFRTR